MTIVAQETPVRVLMLGDSAQTGFGTVTWDLGTRLLNYGIDLRLITQNDTGEPVAEPLGQRAYGPQVIHPANAIYGGFRDGWKPQSVVLLGDYAVVAHIVGQAQEIVDAFGSLPTFHYCPIEGTDLPPTWKLLWDVLRPVAMSEFGADQIELVTGKRPPMLPHGVDTEVFRPVSPSDPLIIPKADMIRFATNWRGDDHKVMTKMGAKKLFGLHPSRLLALRTDRFMPRKNYPAMLRIMVKAMQQVDYLDLLIHCQPQDFGGNLFDLASKYKEQIGPGRIMFSQAHDTYQGVPRSILAALYNAADLYISTGPEGFGLTIAEAMACGVATLALDFSSVSELVGDAGVLVPYAHLIDNEYNHSWAAPDEEAFTAAVVRLATRNQERRTLGEKGPRRIASRYQWDRTAEGFATLIGEAVREHATAR